MMNGGTDDSVPEADAVAATDAAPSAVNGGGDDDSAVSVIEAKPVMIGANEAGDSAEQQQNFTPIQPQINAPMAAVTVQQQQQQNSRVDPLSFLRCRGLPYSANENDVRKFFGEFTVHDVHFTSSVDGKPTGECYVQFGDRDQAGAAQRKDRQTMGSRYIEVFQVGDVEMDQLMRRMQMKKTLSCKGFVRIRGLPYNCNKEQVQQFFRGLTVEEVVFGKEPGLEGRPTGEGFVRFGTADEADRALGQNNQHMGTRYLELFKSDGAAFEAFKARATNNIVPLKALAQVGGGGGDPYASYGYGAGGGGYGSGYEQRGTAGRPMGRGGGGGGYGGGPGSQRYSPYPSYPNYGYGTPRQPGAAGGGFGGGRGGGGAGGGGMPGGGGYDDGYGGYGGGGYGGSSAIGPTKLYMRGIPFRLAGNDIERFFAPLICVDIQVGTMPDGRSSGDGIVEFQTPADARQAMSKDRECIGNRYVELFPSMSAKIPPHVTYDSIGGKGGSRGGGGAVGPVMPSAAQQYAQHPDYTSDYSPYHQAVQQQVAAYASGNYPQSGAASAGMQGGGAGAGAGQQHHHQYGQYPGDYSTAYYGAYGAGAGDVGGGAQPKTDYNWPASQF
uniref:RRM domain-containing protein n=1 Tax=Globodera rostochiensis TaxID=31243 RepID=A0A914HJA7_GLORO